MIKDIGKAIKKNFTKKNIIIFCVAFIFLFSGLLSIMLYGTGNDVLAEQSKEKIVYPEGSVEMYREEMEKNEKNVEFQDIINDTVSIHDDTQIEENGTDISRHDEEEVAQKEEIESNGSDDLKDDEENQIPDKFKEELEKNVDIEVKPATIDDA